MKPASYSAILLYLYNFKTELIYWYFLICHGRLHAESASIYACIICEYCMHIIYKYYVIAADKIYKNTLVPTLKITQVHLVFKFC